MRGYFVTGTDTGVGKTTVGRALLAAATARGLRTRCLKPAETGCTRAHDGDLLAHDAEALWEATDRGQPRASACIYRFEESVAPGVAAAREKVELDFDRIRARFDEFTGQCDFVLVEGAGGLLVPMGRGRTIADLVVCIGLPLLIVARPTLGTINHTLLTIEAAQHRALDVVGVIFSASEGEPDPDAVASNAEEIRAASGVPVLGYLGHFAPEPPLTILGQSIESSLELARLLA
ncbi:dethiobiotin synthase [Haliangium sp.]|uniref:dethiobiotin synthase n=1 Tax=Haliangium sp. TaxID=2663208 RepID=UPI003D104F12